MEREPSIHPDVLAKMAMWDRKTGRKSSDNPQGPLSEEQRKEIGYALTQNPEKEQATPPCPDGQPMPVEVRRKISESHKARRARGQR